MAGLHRLIDNLGEREHGLQFTNVRWNNTILNGDDFILRWNRTVDWTKAVLGLYKINYPSEGDMVLENVANMTNCLEPTYCKWKAESLAKYDLYSFWLANDTTPNAAFAISPPWAAKQPKVTRLTRAAAFLVPIFMLLLLYFLSVTTCMIYKKNREAKRQREENVHTRFQQRQRWRRFRSGSELDVEESLVLTARSSNRHGSFDTTTTVEALEPPEDVLPRQSVCLVSLHTLPSVDSEDAALSASRKSQTAERRGSLEQALAEPTAGLVRI